MKEGRKYQKVESIFPRNFKFFEEPYRIFIKFLYKVIIIVSTPTIDQEKGIARDFFYHTYISSETLNVIMSMTLKYFLRQPRVFNSTPNNCYKITTKVILASTSSQFKHPVLKTRIRRKTNQINITVHRTSYTVLYFSTFSLQKTKKKKEKRLLFPADFCEKL